MSLHPDSGTSTPQLISPLPSPTPQTSIAAEINAATRPLHTSLNRLIISRLPLAVPPHAHDLVPYATGLAAFAAIYRAFETAWAGLALPTTPPSSTPAPSSSYSPAHAAATHRFLSTLIPAALWRTQRLDADLAFLHAAMGPMDTPGRCDDEQQSAAGQRRLFGAHVDDVVALRPHVLLAYAWVMYMAIFSGGRWIRRQLLEGGGPGSWYREDHNHAQRQETWGPDEEAEEMRGLSFLFFDAGTNDGEDVKAEFKRRLEAAEALLTERERGEVVEEAREIFRRCIELVGELDAGLGTEAGLAAVAEKRAAA